MSDITDKNAHKHIIIPDSQPEFVCNSAFVTHEETFTNKFNVGELITVTMYKGFPDDDDDKSGDNYKMRITSAHKMICTFAQMWNSIALETFIQVRPCQVVAL